MITRMDGGGSAVNTLLTSQEQAKAGHTKLALFLGRVKSLICRWIEQEKVDAGIKLFEELGGHVVSFDQPQTRAGYA
ncbi:MAG: hypothetical protein Q9N62_08535 [Ghiorsea sp.]|nr:hypothetical protein [Ghiorsea sp.]